ncbi:hypothetical protein D3C73_1257620 [compost metagenome]
MIAEFPVIIIFDDVAAAGAGPFQQFQPFGHRHNHTARELMGGRDIDGVHTGCAEPFQVEPVRLQRHGLDPESMPAEGSRQQMISGVLDGQRRSRLFKHQGQQRAEHILVAADDNLLRTDAQSAELPQMGGQAHAQGGLALGIAVLQQSGVRELLLIEAAPDFIGKD